MGSRPARPTQYRTHDLLREAAYAAKSNSGDRPNLRIPCWALDDLSEQARRVR